MKSMSDPPLSDIDFINQMAWVWTTLKLDDRDRSFGAIEISDQEWHWWYLHQNVLLEVLIIPWIWCLKHGQLNCKDSFQDNREDLSWYDFGQSTDIRILWNVLMNIMKDLCLIEIRFMVHDNHCSQDSTNRERRE